MTSIPESAYVSHYSNAWESNRLAAKDGWILDPQNRVVILHGVNMSGATKIPGVMYSYKDKHFFEHRSVSFVNRPFPLVEAEMHFERLARWGCQILRVLVPWEALEHSGPGIYDEEYIDYLIQLLKIAAKFGLKCFLDPHVDCWSRFTGGSGMPGWTIELAGMDITKLEPTGSAITQNMYKDKQNFPRMIWATNNSKVASATMYTLFFAGQIFAPQALRGQVNIQHFLQAHFMEAFAHLADRIQKDDARVLRNGGRDREVALMASGTVMGFDSLNEPAAGYLNHPDLNKLLELEDLQIGTCPTPIQGMQLAQGKTVECQVWATGALGPGKKGKVKVNTENVNLWKRPYWKSNKNHKRYPDAIGYSNLCIWADHKVWDPETGKLLQPNYFQRIPTKGYIPPGFQPGKEVEWKHDFWLPFVNTFSLRLRQQDPRLTIFVEPPINEAPPMFRDNIVVAPHFYDGYSNVTRDFVPFTLDFLGYKRGIYWSVLGALKLGWSNVGGAWKEQVHGIQSDIRFAMGPQHGILMGETGLPMDMHDKASFKHRYGSPKQQFALQMLLDAMDASMLSFTLWNYCDDNSNEWGDRWNGEDFSVWSPE
ncbi:glycoside hydrolase superfamily, partial [Linnemannia elongata]